MKNIVLNIETASDLDLPESLLPTVEAPSNYKDPVKIQEYVESKMLQERASLGLSPLTGRIVCISAYDGDLNKINDQEYVMDNLYSSVGIEDEGFLLKSFADKFNEMTTGASGMRYITFNGKSFDIPYLMMASIRYGIRLPFTLDHLRRYYHNTHLDIYELIAQNMGIKKGTLGDWGERLVGMRPWGKGSQVQEWVDAGDLNSIRRHCEENVIVTGKIAKLLTDNLNV